MCFVENPKYFVGKPMYYVGKSSRQAEKSKNLAAVFTEDTGNSAYGARKPDDG